MRINPKEIIKVLKANSGNIRQTARLLGISPGSVINWKKKATSIYGRLRLSSHGLVRKSTRPKTIRSTKILAKHQDEITAFRKKSNFGALKITSILKMPYHHRTVHRLLRSRGLVPDPPAYRRPKLQPTIHMHARNATRPGYLQMDVKYITPQLSGLPYTCFEYALIDIYSRYKEGLVIPNLDSHASVAVLEVLLPDSPFTTHFIQTDNGLEFQAPFLEYLAAAGIEHHFIHKSTPNENAVIERSFRTDEEEFFFWHYQPARDLHDLNNQFQAYLHYYNYERPHLGLELMTPAAKLKSYA